LAGKIYPPKEEHVVPSPRDLLNAAKAEIREVDPREVADHLDEYTLLDVREPDEYEQGALPNAIHVPRGQLEFSVEGRLVNKNAPLPRRPFRISATPMSSL
jgi:hypothetical protein